MPFAVRAVVLVVHADRFTPSGDIAGIEFHVRDVGRHPVLVGLWSRDRWEHPGPALFYVLAAPYRLSGSRSISLPVSALAINGCALLGVLLLALRRGGTALFLATALGLALFVHALGPNFVADVWNPYLPVLPYVALVFLCWAMACGDRWAAPVAAVVASFCVQAHVEYAAIALPLLALGAGWLAVDEVRAIRNARERRASSTRVALLTAGLLALMWAPPVYDEIRHRPGNLTRVVHYFRTSNEPVAGWRGAFHIVGSQFGWLPAWVDRNRPRAALSFEPRLLFEPRAPVLLVVVAAGIALGWVSGRRDLRRLVVFLTAALVLVTVSVAATFRPLYDYRLRPANAVAMLAFVVAGYGAWSFVTGRGAAHVESVRAGVTVVAVVALVALGVAGTVDAVRTAPPRAADGPIVRTLAPRTIARLPARHGTYVFRSGPQPGWVVIGVALALDKAGVGLRVEQQWGVIPGGAPHRVLHAGDRVDGVLTVADGDFLDDVLRAPGARRLLAYWGTPSVSERLRSLRARGAVEARYRRGEIAALRAYGEIAALNRRLAPPAVAVFYQPGPPG